MSLLALLILAAILFSGLLDLYLRRRQIAAVTDHRDAVPADFRDVLSLDEHRRAADYAVANARLGAARTAAETAFALALPTLLLAPAFVLASALAPEGPARSMLVALAVGALDYLLALSFAAARAFGVEARFGFNRASPRLFALDEAKGLALRLLAFAPLLYGFFALQAALPRAWPLVGWAAGVLLLCALAIVLPTFVAPLFHRFRPLPESAVKARIEALLARRGYGRSGLFVVDASTRSSHGNAYFAGFGKARRIVLYDTLLARHSDDEIVSVLAHELGHCELGHVRRRLLEAALLLGALFAALFLAFHSDALAAAFGLPADPGVTLVVALAAAGPLARLLAPALNFLSRRAEFEADAFAGDMVGRAPMIAALTRLSRDNLATLTPDRLYAAFYYSHPPIPARVARLGEA
ncbi:M48 family metallopeptidase [Methylocella sp.]|uniref:M48 family metallopeptidase n=1 Tax=Methylocella sp. TaxID=1978226 RepID=UPI0035B37825